MSVSDVFAFSFGMCVFSLHLAASPTLLSSCAASAFLNPPFFCVFPYGAHSPPQCCQRCPAALRPQFYANVLLTGGNCTIPNLRERLYRDLRASAPIHCEVNVILPEEPMLHAWRGMETFPNGIYLADHFAEMRGDLNK